MTKDVRMILESLTFADWTARVWKDCGIATEHRGTGMGLTENAAIVTDTLGTVV